MQRKLSAFVYGNKVLYTHASKTSKIHACIVTWMYKLNYLQSHDEAYTHICVQAYEQTSMRAQMNICMQASKHTCIHTCMHTFIQTYIRIYINIDKHVHMHINTYIHAY